MAQARTGKRVPILVIQEAGLDGFWIHRVLQKNEKEIDSSIAGSVDSTCIQSLVLRPWVTPSGKVLRQAFPPANAALGAAGRGNGPSSLATLLRKEPRPCAGLSVPNEWN